jgi:hypothetical protein
MQNPSLRHARKQSSARGNRTNLERKRKVSPEFREHGDAQEPEPELYLAEREEWSEEINIEHSGKHREYLDAVDANLREED